jgi:hypothetical protein
MHQCYACDRIFTYRGEATEAKVPARFEGPPGNANGGIAAAALICPALHAASRDGGRHAAALRVTARIRAGVPLNAPVAVIADPAEGGYDVALRAADTPLVTGAVQIMDFDAPPRRGDVLASIPDERERDISELAAVAVPDSPPFFEETGDHPIPACFSCGPKHPDGLYIYPRVVGDGVTCAPWRPAPEFDDGGGVVAQLILTSALDCSSGICMPIAMQRDLLDRDQFFLLGSLDVRYLRLPPLEQDYRVAAKALARDGRKFFGMSALFDGAGTPYAYVDSAWIISGVSRTEAFGARTQRERRPDRL